MTPFYLGIVQVAIATQNGDQITVTAQDMPALIAGPWAITPSLSKKGHTVTHLPTGRATWKEISLEAAMQIIDLLFDQDVEWCCGAFGDDSPVFPQDTRAALDRVRALVATDG